MLDLKLLQGRFTVAGSRSSASCGNTAAAATAEEKRKKSRKDISAKLFILIRPYLSSRQSSASLILVCACVFVCACLCVGVWVCVWLLRVPFRQRIDIAFHSATHAVTRLPFSTSGSPLLSAVLSATADAEREVEAPRLTGMLRWRWRMRRGK